MSVQVLEELPSHLVGPRHIRTLARKPQSIQNLRIYMVFLYFRDQTFQSLLLVGHLLRFVKNGVAVEVAT